MARTLLAAALLFPVAGPAQSATPETPADLEFTVLRGDSPIGRHRIRFDRRGNDLIAAIEIDLIVRFGFLALFRYEHRNREVWRDGRLIALDSRTDDNGRLYQVRARAVGGGVEIEAGGRTFMAPADVMPTSYWHPDTVGRASFLDTQHGRLIDLDIAVDTPPAIDFGGARIPATRYRVTGDLEMTLWYADTGDWLGAAFDARGAEISYRPRDAVVRLADQGTGSGGG